MNENSPEIEVEEACGGYATLVHIRSMSLNATVKPAHAGDGEQRRQRRIDTIACSDATSSMDIFGIWLATTEDLRHFWCWQLSSCISNLTQHGTLAINVTLHLTFIRAFSTVRGLSSMHFSKVAESPLPL
mgnify:CR=1 FL=1